MSPTPIRIFFSYMIILSAVSGGECRLACNTQDKQTGSNYVGANFSVQSLIWRNTERTDKQIYKCHALNVMDFLVRLSIVYIHPDFF